MKEVVQTIIGAIVVILVTIALLNMAEAERLARPADHHTPEERRYIEEYQHLFPDFGNDYVIYEDHQ